MLCVICGEMRSAVQDIVGRLGHLLNSIEVARSDEPHSKVLRNLESPGPRTVAVLGFPKSAAPHSWLLAVQSRLAC